MAHLNVKDRVIEAKIVYFGAGLSGKTTNLEQVKKLSEGGRSGEMISLDTDGDRTLFFDWLPFDVGRVNGCDVKLQLFTVPGQPQYAETRRKVLSGADGIVMVLDSQSGAVEKNREVMTDLRSSLSANGLSLDEVAFVLQLNKRDLPTAMPADALLEAAGLGGHSYIEAVAAEGRGVFETLREVTRLVLAKVRDAAKDRRPDLLVGGTSGLDGASLYKAITGSESLPAKSRSGAEARSGAPATTATHKPMTNGAPTIVPSHPASAAPGQNGSTAQRSVDERATSSRSAAPSEAGPSALQIGEAIAAVRTSSRRIDQLERTIEQSLASSLRKAESSIVDRTNAGLTTAAEALRDALRNDGREREGRLASSVSSLAAEVDDLKSSLRSLEELRASLAPLDELAARMPAIDGIRDKLSALDVIESRVATLAVARDVDRHLRAIEAMVVDLSKATEKLDRISAVEGTLGAGLGAIESREKSILERLVAVDGALVRLDDVRTRLDLIDKKVSPLVTLERRMEALEKDRVSTSVLDGRLGAVSKHLVDQVEALMDQKLGRERAFATELSRGLAKATSEHAQVAASRHETLLGAVVQVEGRVGRLDARAETESRRYDDVVARLEGLGQSVVDGLKGLDTRIGERLAATAKAIESSKREGQDQTRALGDRVAEVGVVVRKLADELTQKKGWFR